MSFQCKVAGAQDSWQRREICIKDVRCPHDIAITSKIDSRNGTLPLQYISYLSNVPLAIEHHHEHHSSELRPAESPFAYQPHRSPKGKHLIGQLSAASSRGIHGKNLLGSAKKCTPDSSKRYVWAFVPGAEQSRAVLCGWKSQKLNVLHAALVNFVFESAPTDRSSVRGLESLASPAAWHSFLGF